MLSKLDPRLGHEMLRIARRAIVSHLQGDAPSLPGPDASAPVPNHGVFVTLRKQAALRGCMGTFSTSDDLQSVVAKVAMAALRDPRFAGQRLSPQELAALRIELSILSPLEPISHPLDFDLGVHGIHVRKGECVGCFLPDVGAESGWDKETFLSQLCQQKAGMKPDAWKTGGIELHRFTVTKFMETPMCA